MKHLIEPLKAAGRAMDALAEAYEEIGWYATQASCQSEARSYWQQAERIERLLKPVKKQNKKKR